MSERQVNKEQKAQGFKPFPGVVATEPGSRLAPVYKSIYVKEADCNLVRKVDEFDIFEFIQASKSQTDLAILEKRFTELGEIPAVDPSLGSNDLTNMPSNIHEVYNMVNDINANFSRLPQSIQDIFGSKEAYMKSLLDGTYQSTLINAINAAANQKQEEKPQEGE